MKASPGETIRRYLDDHGGETEATVEHLLTTFGFQSSDESARPQIVHALAAAGVRVEPSLEGLSDHDTLVVSTIDPAPAAADTPSIDDEVAMPAASGPPGDATESPASAADPHPPSERDTIAGPDAETRKMNTPPSADPGTPQRVCRKCSAISETDGEFCPHCGTPYQRRTVLPRARSRARSKKSHWSSRRKALIAGIPLLLLIAGIGVGIYLKIDHDNQVASDRRAAERKRKEAARERQRQQAEAARQRKAEEELQTALRDSSVKQLEKAVTKDARGRVAEGFLDGPIMRTECSPNAGEDPTDPDLSSATYECIAVNKETGTQIQGPRFTGTIDFDSGDIRWHLGE